MFAISLLEEIASEVLFSNWNDPYDRYTGLRDANYLDVSSVRKSQTASVTTGISWDRLGSPGLWDVMGLEGKVSRDQLGQC